MKKLGFAISNKENEKRRAITLNDAKKIINKDYVFFEEGYGNNLGFTDDEIKEAGFKILPHNKIYECDIICEPKIGDSEEIYRIKNKTLFGWVHATQNYNITQAFINNCLTGYAWEKMFDGKRHIFNKNNQIAGEAAILHAMILYGKTFEKSRIAILGNGNTSKGVQQLFDKFNYKYDIFTSATEKDFKSKLEQYDVIVNCILWDVKRKDHIIYKNDLKRLKKGSIIIDISCDANGGIETSIPTTIDNPTYFVDGVMHYVVDHTPSLLYKKATEEISKEVVKYIDLLVEEKDNVILSNSLIIKDGKILDNEINLFQNR